MAGTDPKGCVSPPFAAPPVTYPPGCPCCGDEDATPEFHRLEGGDVEFAGTDGVFVCRSCHARLHGPGAPSFTELTCVGRPSCPRCGAGRTVKVLWGYAPGPGPVGTATVGCIITDDTPEFLCSVCDHEWRTP